MTVGGGRKRSTRKNKKVVKRGRKTVRSKTARKQRAKRVRSGRRISRGGSSWRCPDGSIPGSNRSLHTVSGC